MNKKILVITPDIPRPNGKGYQSLSYDRVMAYKQNGFEIFIVSHSLKITKNDEIILREFEKKIDSFSYEQYEASA